VDDEVGALIGVVVVIFVVVTALLSVDIAVVAVVLDLVKNGYLTRLIVFLREFVGPKI
jgi:hypothetical protein